MDGLVGDKTDKLHLIDNLPTFVERKLPKCKACILKHLEHVSAKIPEAAKDSADKWDKVEAVLKYEGSSDN